MTSSVSVVSDFVANGHQIMPNDSCSPSKIPYSGFSPVRLQTGIQPRPSSAPPELKRKTRIPSGKTNLYAAKVQVSPPIVLDPPRQFSGAVNRELSRPEALGSPEGYAVPPSLCLLWPHLKLSVSPTGLSSSSRRVFALRSGRGRSREAPQFTPHVSLTVPPSVPRQTRWNPHRPSRFRLRTFRFRPFRLLVPKSLKPYPCFLYPKTVPPPSTLAFASSVQARRLHFPHPCRISGGLCHEAATFALCYGPVSCLLFTGKSFYFRAFASRSRLQKTSNITIRPYSQLPEPDFHRQDIQHCGLRTEHTEGAENKYEEVLRTFTQRKDGPSKSSLNPEGIYDIGFSFPSIHRLGPFSEKWIPSPRSAGEGVSFYRKLVDRSVGSCANPIIQVLKRIELRSGRPGKWDAILKRRSEK